MKRPNQNPTTIDATLDNLYANELNVELSWDHKRGFRAVLGNPPLAKKAFPTSGKAVSWLKEQALRHFTRAEFPTKGPGTAGRETILDQLCESHIAGSISWVWDGGFYATIGEPKRAKTYSAASRWRSNRLAARSGDPPIIPTANSPTNMPGSAFR
jgi:hypothetical protein